MNTTIRTYRIPILVTLLMVAALAFREWQWWQNILERKEERQRQHAAGVFETIEGGHPRVRKSLSMMGLVQ